MIGLMEIVQCALLFVRIHSFCRIRRVVVLILATAVPAVVFAIGGSFLLLVLLLFLLSLFLLLFLVFAVTVAMLLLLLLLLLLLVFGVALVCVSSP